ncbi:MAG TPA: hypothetical protein VLM78_10700 [Anaerolineales bacterium]|nr:hypothetical protein [Anaerolineales bacterium]
MIDNTEKPTQSKPATSMAAPETTDKIKPSATARARVAKAAAPASKRAPTPVKPATAAEKKNTSSSPARAKPAQTRKNAPETFPVTGKRADKPAKVKKAKRIRDSFTMPEGEYALIALLKKRCLDAGMPAKKSEILRAAIANLAKLSDTAVVSAVRKLQTINTGRPDKASK